MAVDPVFIDRNVLVAAAVDLHPSHGVAAAYLARVAAEGGAVASAAKCDVVATMRAHGVGRLTTLNIADFERYADVIQLERLVS